MTTTNKMPDSHTSPNPIPPRTSSTGVINGAASSPPPPPPNAATSQNYVMNPVPEDQWLASPPSSSTPKPPGTRKHHGQGHARSKSMGHHHHRRKLSATNSSSNDKSPDNTNNRGAAATWSLEKERILLGPYDYMVQQPGKDIRRQLIAAFNRWLQVPEESLAIITKVVAMLHTSSLLVDDVEDSAMLRRGVPVANNIFGTAQTLNSANYVYFLALEEIQKLKNSAAIQIYTGELLNLHRGQGMDLYWRDTLTCPTEEDYLEMVGNKTGGLFRLAVKLMQGESEAAIDCIPLVNVMGLIFQVCDDYLNLSNPMYSQNKGMCEDLTEGKFSFPIIHSIRAHPANLQLVNILKQKTRDDEVKRYAINYMESTGSFAYTRNTVEKLREKALASIDSIEASLPSEPSSGESVRSVLERIVQSTLQSGSGKDKI